MKQIAVFLILFMWGCATTWIAPPDFIQKNIKTEHFTLFTYQKISNDKSPIHIYIEGDGHAFDATGTPTHDPTPHSPFLRQLAANDTNKNVAYIARPCQYIMTDQCCTTDWTSGRFSQQAIDSVRDAIKHIAGTRPIVLIGYSGGAMISGLIINQNPTINIQKWVTIAGVLNHNDWTQFFNDTPLYSSVNLNTLPQIKQTHYVAEHDKVVPMSLSKKWIDSNDIIVVPNASHNHFPELKISYY